MLAVIDRSTATGKRNYAIILLAARLGLRAGDISALRLESIDWKHSCIRLTQRKTQEPIELPMPGDVGNALADYLRHARPITTLREIFLRRLAPIAPFGRHNNLHGIIQKYRVQAGLPQKDQCGLHSLRHTLATNLLAIGAKPGTISNVLGHHSPDSTSLYLRFDIENLRQVGLNPDEEVCHA
jgi:integrase